MFSAHAFRDPPATPIVPRERVMTLAERHIARLERVEAARGRAARIIAEVAHETGVEVEALLSSRRGRTCVARDAAAYRIWAELSWSFAKIGRRLGRHHASIMRSIGGHALRNGLPAPETCLRMAKRYEGGRKS